MSGQKPRLGSGNRARKLSGGANEAPRFKTARRLVNVLVRPSVASDGTAEVEGRTRHLF